MSHRAVTARRFSIEAMPAGSGAVAHDHSAVGFVVAGSATVWSGAAYALRAGDLMLIPEAAPHYLIDSDGAQMWGLAVCAPCASEPWGVALSRAMAAVRGGAAAVRRPGDGVADLERSFERLAIELEAGDPAGDLAVSGHLSLIAAAISRASPVGEREVLAGAPLVAAAIGFIEERALDGISLADVAAAVGRAPAHLAAVVKRETGRTVVDWITRTRMAHVRALLLRSDETIEAIAERVGFASASHFHRTFRRYHDTTPSRWRQLHLRGHH